MSQTTAAKYFRVSLATIWRLENGKGRVSDINRAKIEQVLTQEMAVAAVA